MPVVWRAADVPVASRVEYVHEAVGAALGPLDVRAADGNEVPDQVRVADLGTVRVDELSASKPGGADRRRRHIRMMDAGLCKVDVVAQGEVVLEQDAARPASVPATSRPSTSPAPPTGPTRGRHRSWPPPSRATSSRSAATTSPG